MNPSLKYAKLGHLSFRYFYAKNTTKGLHFIGMAHMLPEGFPFSQINLFIKMISPTKLQLSLTWSMIFIGGLNLELKNQHVLEKTNAYSFYQGH